MIAESLYGGFYPPYENKEEYVVKPFFVLVSLLVVLTGGISIHYLVYNNDAQKELLASVVKITEISSHSLSVAYYEPRVFLYDEVSNPAYPQMQAINKMDLVYEQ